ncbi:hypothetical protein Btru_060015 [Bulinus truncatus]|nr:hypothetical protein Btru_060015 [Bulinus truncatus]
MDLPKHYLPTRTCPHVGVHPYQRFLFADYGSYENLNVTVEIDGSREFVSCWPQKGNKTIKDLTKLLPSLPLFEKPLQDEWNEGDSILGMKNLNDSLEQIKSFVSCLKIAKGEITKGGKKFQYVDKFKAMRTSYQKCRELSQHFTDRIFQRFLSDYTEISKAHNLNCLNGFNRDYYGGLISASSSDQKDKHYLSYVGGPDLRDIYVAAVSTDPKSRLKTPHILSKHSFDGRLLQLDTHSNCDGRLLLCARMKQECQLFLADFGSRSLEPQDKVTLSNDSWTSTSFSKYMENEVLLSSDYGDVYLWDINSQHNKIIQKAPRFHCPDRWSCSYFAGHPREVVVADNTSVEIFDHRSHFRDGLELFSLSSQRTTINERIMGAGFLDFPYHAVATDFTLFIVDQRFCSSPVFQWSTEFKAAPQYLKIINNEIFPGKLVFLASQQPAETMSFPLNIQSGQVPTSTFLPWKISAIGEFNQSQYRDYICDINMASRKFQTSLAGFAVTEMSRSDGFTVYQMDSYGDIFYQTVNMYGSLSCCSVDRATEPERHAASCRIDNWLRHFDCIVQSSVAKNQVLNLTREAIDPEIITKVQSLPLPGVECSAAKSTTKLHRSLKRLESLPQGANTRLLLALRDGKDISKLVEEREEYHENQKEKMKKKLQKKFKKTGRKSQHTACVSSKDRSKYSPATAAVDPLSHSCDEISTQELHTIETSDRKLRSISTQKKRMPLISSDQALPETSNAESLESSGSLFDISEFRDMSSDSSENEVRQKKTVKKRSISKNKLDKASVSLPLDHEQLSGIVKRSPYKRKARKSHSEQKQKRANTELNFPFGEEESNRPDLSITCGVYKEICWSPNPFESQSEEETRSLIIPLQSNTGNETIITEPSAISPHPEARRASCDVTDWSSDIPLAQGGLISAQNIHSSQVTLNASLLGPTQETSMTQSSEASIFPFDLLKARSSRELRLDTTQICKMLFEDSPPCAFESGESHVTPVSITQSSPPKAQLPSDLVSVNPNLNLDMTFMGACTQDTLLSFNNELSGLFKKFHLSHTEENSEFTLNTSHVSDSSHEIMLSDSNRSSPLKILSHSTPCQIQSAQASSSFGPKSTSLTKKKLEFKLHSCSARKNSVSDNQQPNFIHPETAIQNAITSVTDIPFNGATELTSRDQLQKILNWLQDNSNESDMPNSLCGQMNTPSNPSTFSSSQKDRQSPHTWEAQNTNSIHSRGSQSDSDSDSIDSVCSSLPASVTRMSLLSPSMKYLVDPGLAGFLSSPKNLRKKNITSRSNDSMIAK